MINKVNIKVHQNAIKNSIPNKGTESLILNRDNVSRVLISPETIHYNGLSSSIVMDNILKERSTLTLQSLYGFLTTHQNLIKIHHEYYLAAKKTGDAVLAQKSLVELSKAYKQIIEKKDQLQVVSQKLEIPTPFGNEEVALSSLRIKEFKQKTEQMFQVVADYWNNDNLGLCTSIVYSA